MHSRGMPNVFKSITNHRLVTVPPTLDRLEFPYRRHSGYVV
jgi:hypothetical protein